MRVTDSSSAMSSSDPRADRRFLYAENCVAEGDHAAAAELFEQCLELAPDWAPAWFALGMARERLGNLGAAISAYRRVLAHDAEDMLGASLALARLGAAEIPAAAAPAYVARLFDQYAPRFDEHLVDGLGYRAPYLLHDAATEVCARMNRAMRFAHALDLGCGTGLAGAAFRDSVGHLEGVDLSPGMIAQARAKGTYEALHVADALHHLRASPDGVFDLILAADVLVYIGGLVPLFAQVARVLAGNGLFAFTADSHDGDGYVIGSETRYGHSSSYIEGVAGDAGLSVRLMRAASTRNNKGAEVSGLVVALER
jgi:predicted TPR repeat methyltransferase